MNGFLVLFILFIVFYISFGIGIYLKMSCSKIRSLLYFLFVLPGQTLYISAEIWQKLCANSEVKKKKKKYGYRYMLIILILCLQAFPTFGSAIAISYITERKKKIKNPLRRAKNECVNLISRELTYEC